jgi:hypothetical protein
MIHVFPSNLAILRAAQQALDDIGAFLRQQLLGTAPHSVKLSPSRLLGSLPGSILIKRACVHEWSSPGRGPTGNCGVVELRRNLSLRK